jgi:hypothetical protein
MIAQPAELNRNKDPIAGKAFDGFTDEFLIVPDSIKVAGVEEVDALFQGVPNGSDAFAIVRLLSTVKIRHSHASQSQSR